MLSEAELDPTPRAARRVDCSAPMWSDKMLRLKMTTGSEHGVHWVASEGITYI